MKIFDDSNGHFTDEYYNYVRNNKLNQLFRNELIGQSFLQNKKYDFVITGLFCSHEDDYAISAAKSFKSKLRKGDETFKLITYKNYIESIQKLNIVWDIREWTMLLWSRYCAADQIKWLNGI